MAAPSRWQGDVYINGHLRALDFTAPDGSINDDAIAAGSDVDATKLEHQHRAYYSQESDTTSATEDHVIHVVYGATGDIVAFEAGSVTVCTGNATITVDLHKNGASILDDPIELSVAEGSAAYVVQAASVATAGLVDGDVLEVVVIATVGTGALGKGVFAALTVHELAQ